MGNQRPPPGACGERSEGRRYPQPRGLGLFSEPSSRRASRVQVGARLRVMPESVSDRNWTAAQACPSALGVRVGD
jgi:hypothetical protein